MGYRIHYAMGGGTMRATVLGKSSLAHAAGIARDIAEQAAQRAVKQLLIDVRGLVDRVGTLGTLVLATCRPVSDCRVALLDTHDNDRYHPFSEGAAHDRGYAVRYFDDPAAALSWLRSSAD